jgi:methylmalonyl-CoA mutase N-terminal domain/subunit
MDETLALPSEKAVQIALRTQQIIAHEIGVTNTADPLAGSYFVESMTERMEIEAEEYFRRIDALGGVVAAIETGFFQKEISDAAYRYQREIEEKEKIIVGVNEFVEEEATHDIQLLTIGPEIESSQKKRLHALRESRSAQDVTMALHALKQSAVDGSNLMPRLLDAARAQATLGEMCDVLVEPFGIYHEATIF